MQLLDLAVIVVYLAASAWLGLRLSGRQDNLALREAAVAALGFNLLMVAAAIASIVLTVPKGRPQ